jgi:hypothetical protein
MISFGHALYTTRSSPRQYTMKTSFKQRYITYSATENKIGAGISMKRMESF